MSTCAIWTGRGSSRRSPNTRRWSSAVGPRSPKRSSSAGRDSKSSAAPGAASTTSTSTRRPNAILVNCARGEIVDERALAEALRAKKISGAAIDVFATEPPSGSPLLEAPNVVFTPHLGASTSEGQSRAGAIVADQVLKVLAGKRPDFVVNPKVYA